MMFSPVVSLGLSLYLVVTTYAFWRPERSALGSLVVLLLIVAARKDRSLLRFLALFGGGFVIALCVVAGASIVGSAVGEGGQDSTRGIATLLAELGADDTLFWDPLGRLLLALAVIVCLSCVDGASAWLMFLDRIRCPRHLTYILLSVASAVGYARTQGRRQVLLLERKQVGERGIASRLRAYRRVALPLFRVLMSHQFVHAESLYYRGFFEKEEESVSLRYRVEGLAPALALGAAYLGVLCV